MYKEQRNIEAINHLILSMRSPRIKMIALADIDYFRDDFSIPALVKMLSYDLPWFCLLDENLYVKPHNVRLAAHRILASHGPERAGGAVMLLLSSENVYERLYGAATTMRWGDARGERVLDETIKSGNQSIREEAERVR